MVLDGGGVAVAEFSQFHFPVLSGWFLGGGDDLAPAVWAGCLVNNFAVRRFVFCGSCCTASSGVGLSMARLAIFRGG